MLTIANLWSSQVEKQKENITPTPGGGEEARKPNVKEKVTRAFGTK